MTSWREVLEQLDISTSNAAGPAGAEGDWAQLQAAFGTKAFLRALSDGEVLALECVPPAEASAARAALEAAGWKLDGDDVPFVAKRDFPNDSDALRPLWISIVKLADSTRDEDGDAFIAALAVAEPEADDSGEADSGDEVPEPEDDDSSADDKGSTTSGSAFESIGEDSPPPQMTDAFTFTIGRAGDVVEAKLGFNEPLERHVFEKLEKRLIGNLRGKYDVDVTIVGAADVSVQLAVEPKTRIALRVESAVGAKDMTVRQVEENVASYLDTLAELATAGIDPLVFLGVRASKRNTGAFESIGVSAPKSEEKTAAPERDEPEQPDEDEETVLFVEDEPSEGEEDEGEVVFGAPPLDEDAPLEPGRYDDERLKRPDATTSLVDVILRHPGYSDRNIGQVLSILLSLDYAACLEIAERAPTVVAWGVARERALTMKTVMEGAGGKVNLVEPGTFHED